MPVSLRHHFASAAEGQDAVGKWLRGSRDHQQEDDWYAADLGGRLTDRSKPLWTPPVETGAIALEVKGRTQFRLEAGSLLLINELRDRHWCVTGQIAFSCGCVDGYLRIGAPPETKRPLQRLLEYLAAAIRCEGDAESCTKSETWEWMDAALRMARMRRLDRPVLLL